MRSRIVLFIVAMLVGGVIGYVWNWPGIVVHFQLRPDPLAR